MLGKQGSLKSAYAVFRLPELSGCPIFSGCPNFSGCLKTGLPSLSAAFTMRTRCKAA